MRDEQIEISPTVNNPLANNLTDPHYNVRYLQTTSIRQITPPTTEKKGHQYRFAKWTISKSISNLTQKQTNQEPNTEKFCRNSHVFIKRLLKSNPIS